MGIKSPRRTLARDARAVKPRGRGLWSSYASDPAIALDAPMPANRRAYTREVIALIARPGAPLMRQVSQSVVGQLHPTAVVGALDKALLILTRRAVIDVDADKLSHGEVLALRGELTALTGYPVMTLRSGGARAYLGGGEWYSLPAPWAVGIAQQMGLQVVHGYHLLAYARDEEMRARIIEIGRARGADPRADSHVRLPSAKYRRHDIDLDAKPRHELERRVIEEAVRRYKYRAEYGRVIRSVEWRQVHDEYWRHERRRTDLIAWLRGLPGDDLWSPDPSAGWRPGAVRVPPTGEWPEDDPRWEALIEWHTAIGDTEALDEINHRRGVAGLTEHDAAQQLLDYCRGGDRERAVALAETTWFTIEQVARFTRQDVNRVYYWTCSTLGGRVGARPDEPMWVWWRGVEEIRQLPLPCFRREGRDRTASATRRLDTSRLPRSTPLGTGRREASTQSPPMVISAWSATTTVRRSSDLDAAIREVEQDMLRHGYDPAVDRSAAAYLSLGELRRRGFVDREPISSWVTAYGAESMFLAAYVTDRETGLPHSNPKRGPQRFEHDWAKQEAKGRWWKQEARSREAVEQAVAAERASAGRKRRCLARASSVLGPFLDAKPTLAGALHVLLALCVERGRPAPGYRSIQLIVGCRSLSTVALFVEVLIDLGLIRKVGPIRKGWPDLRAQEFEILLPSEDEIRTALYAMYPDLKDSNVAVRRRIFDFEQFDWLDPQLIEHVQSARLYEKADDPAVSAETTGRAPPPGPERARQRMKAGDAGRLIDQVRAMRDAGLPSGFLVRASAAVLGVEQREVLAELATGTRTTVQLAALVGDESRLIGKAWSMVTASQHDSERVQARLDVRRLAMDMGGRSGADDREQAAELWAMLEEVGEVEPRYSDEVVDKARARLVASRVKQTAAA